MHSLLNHTGTMLVLHWKYFRIPKLKERWVLLKIHVLCAAVYPGFSHQLFKGGWINRLYSRSLKTTQYIQCICIYIFTTYSTVQWNKIKTLLYCIAIEANMFAMYHRLYRKWMWCLWRHPGSGPVELRENKQFFWVKIYRMFITNVANMAALLLYLVSF